MGGCCRGDRGVGSGGVGPVGLYHRLRPKGPPHGLAPHCNLVGVHLWSQGRVPIENTGIIKSSAYTMLKNCFP